MGVGTGGRVKLETGNVGFAWSGEGEKGFCEVKAAVGLSFNSEAGRSQGGDITSCICSQSYFLLLYF